MRRRPWFALFLLQGIGCPRGALPSLTEAPAPAPTRAQDASAPAPRPAAPIGSDSPTSAESAERYYVPLLDAPVLGPPDAAVTIVAFSDFECPFCERGHRIMQQLRRRYPDTVRIAYKAFPLDMHPYALLAAMAGRSAQAQGKFWEFHDRMYSQPSIDFETIVGHAQAAQVDLNALQHDLKTLEYGPEVSRDLRLGKRLGIHSTPTFFINGRMLGGAQPPENFESIIEQEIALVERWRNEGLDPKDTYARAIADGYRKVVFTEAQQHSDPDTVTAVPIGSSPVRGPAHAPVTIVAFGDFECPYCARGNQTIEALRQLYGDSLRIVYKHSPLPFHSHAYLAARAAVAAQAQGKFWEFHDALYARGARFNDDDLSDIAKKAGLDLRKFRKAMSRLELDAAIEADLALAMSLGVSGTPAYFINGRPIHGAQPELVFRLMIEEELDRARSARARGVAPEALYETLTHTPLSDAPVL